MALPDLFSRRMRAATGAADVYQYDDVPRKVRVQIVHVLRETIGSYFGNEYTNVDTKGTWDYIWKTTIKELGVFNLTAGGYTDKSDDFTEWMISERNVHDYIDALELCLKLIDSYVRRTDFVLNRVAVLGPDEAIGEINARLREGGVGYQYEGGEIVRVDSQFIHAEMVVPALKLLTEKKYDSAEKEYREAHLAYREGRNEDSIVCAAKAFESVLKIIGNERSWAINTTDPAKKLLDAAFDAGFLTNLVQSGFTSLRSLLESGVPTPRNRSAGHGAGSSVRSVPAHLAAFVLHQTAAAIVFLEEQHRNTP
jgi:hypothetical protein